MLNLKRTQRSHKCRFWKHKSGQKLAQSKLIKLLPIKEEITERYLSYFCYIQSMWSSICMKNQLHFRSTLNVRIGLFIDRNQLHFLFICNAILTLMDWFPSEKLGPLVWEWDLWTLWYKVYVQYIARKSLVRQDKVIYKQFIGQCHVNATYIFSKVSSQDVNLLYFHNEGCSLDLSWWIIKRESIKTKTCVST